MIKYAVYPGIVWSKYDRDRHYIGARVLMQLYGVKPCECVVIDYDRPSTVMGVSTKGLIRLHPDFHGDYILPKEDKDVHRKVDN